MEWLSETLSFSTRGKGLYTITGDVADVVRRWKVNTGMCFLFCPHTSASITLCESYDPQSRSDVENYFERAVPENQSWYQHIYEGPDDSPSHIRTTLSQSSMSMPIDSGKLGLGTWQGIFLFEHRSVPHNRRLSIRALKIE